MVEVTGHCHCGAVQVTVPELPVEVQQCNCSLCRKSGWIGGYCHPDQVTITAEPDALTGYVQGDRTIRVWHCRICGTHSHWTPLTASPDRMGINMRIFDLTKWCALPVRQVDGASF